MTELADNKLKISQLRAFVAIAQHKNFSTAALELGVSQSTVSHAIATLETELGIVLLNRGRHGATLTPEGAAILPEAVQILELLSSIQTKAVLATRLQAGQVRIATVRSVATHFLPEAIAQFREKYPHVSVTIREFDHYDNVQSQLREGQAEIGFTTLPAPEEFDAWELFQDEFVALLPPEAPQQKTPLTWEQLASYPMIMTPMSPPHHHARSIRNHLAKFGQTLQVAYEVKEDSTVISMVRRGLGASIMARLAAEPIPPEIQVCPLPVRLYRVIGVITVEEALLSRAVFAFLDVLKTLVLTQSSERLQKSETTAHPGSDRAVLAQFPPRDLEARSAEQPAQ